MQFWFNIESHHSCFSRTAADSFKRDVTLLDDHFYLFHASSGVRSFFFLAIPCLFLKIKSLFQKLRCVLSFIGFSLSFKLSIDCRKTLNTSVLRYFLVDWIRVHTLLSFESSNLVPQVHDLQCALLWVILSQGKCYGCGYILKIASMLLSTELNAHNYYLLECLF